MILNAASKITPLTNEKVATFRTQTKVSLNSGKFPRILLSYELNVNLS